MLIKLIDYGGLPTHTGMQIGTDRVSKDYKSVYIPLEFIKAEELKMNKVVELTTAFKFGTAQGRALVSLNPKLNDFFRDINGDTVLEPGETYTVVGKAKKNLDEDELRAAFAEDGNWLYRVSVLR